MNFTANNNQPVVLVVDDDQDNLLLIGYQVSLLAACSVISASNGNTALTMAQQFQPSLILLDVMLPDVDGLEVMRRLKQDPQTHHIPIVAVSAIAQTREIERAIKAGFDDYLIKPYELESLELLINRYLCGSHLYPIEVSP